MASVSLLYAIPTKQSSDIEWIQWHKNMKARLGKKNANMLFIQAFEKRGSTSIVSEDMQNYFDKQGIPLQQTDWQALKGVISDSTDFASDIFKAGTYTAIGLAGILALSLGILVFNIARSAKASDVTSIVGGKR